jgi:hypothetical protein
MAFIYSLDGNRPGSGIPISLDQGETGEFQLLIECREGYFLSAVADGPDDYAVEARLTGASSWVDIVADPIDLSPFEGNRESFDFRIVVDADAAIDPANQFRLPRIRVSMNP